MKKIILMFGFILFASFAFANNSICDYIITDLGIEKGMALPSGMPYGNERLNFYSGGVAVGHITTVDKKVDSLSCNLTTNPTYVVTVKDLETIKSIATSESPVDALDDSISKGDLTLKGQTTTKKIKGFFTRFGIKIASWFM